MNLVKEEHSLASPEISVIIPFYGDKNDLSNCLRGLQRQNLNSSYEIIVVESGNNPEVKQLIKVMQNATLISSNSLMFPGKARNLGIAGSKANLLGFIDADCVPPPNWLFEIYSSLKNGNEIVIGPITNLYPFHPLASVDNLLQFPDFQKHRSTNHITHFPACNFGITKDLFMKTEGFREDVETGEDVIFSESVIRKCKGKMFFNNRLIVRHSGRKNFIQFIEHNESLGFYRGYLNLKISLQKNKFRSSFLYSFMFGLRRLIYISVRTLQWNQAGLFRIIFYFPFLLIGLSAWTKGFWQGNQQNL